MATLGHLFKLHPKAKKVFGCGESEEIGNAHVAVHVGAFAGLFDSVFQMLGSDVEFISEILAQVGRKHKAMGVSPSMFPYMGQAVILAFEEFLQKKLTENEKIHWEVVYEAVSNEIIKNILK